MYSSTLVGYNSPINGGRAWYNRTSVKTVGSGCSPENWTLAFQTPWAQDILKAQNKQEMAYPHEKIQHFETGSGALFFQPQTEDALFK